MIREHEMKKRIGTIALWVGIAVFAAAALYGGYYILRVKPRKEARSACAREVETYGSVYAEYEKTLRAYNEKVDQCTAEGKRLEEAHKELEKVIASDAPYSESMIEAAEAVIKNQKKKLETLPEHQVAFEKEESAFAAEFSGEEENSVSGNEEEYLAEAQFFRQETEKLRGEIEALSEMTEKLKVPDFSGEVEEIRVWTDRISNSVYDPFENLVIAFAGTEPNGTVTIEKKSDSGINGEYDFSVDTSTKLCNGDELIVTVKPKQNLTPEELNEELIGKYGKALSSFEKIYTVDGLSYYLTEMPQLSEDAFSKMQAKAEESLRAYAEKNWKDEVTIQEMKYAGSYFLDRKATNQGFYQESAKNRIVLLYRVKCRIDLSPRGKDYQKDVEYIYSITYSNVINLADGTCSVDYGAYTEPEDSFRVDTGVKSGLFTKYKYTFKGYADTDEAFNRIVAAQSEHYTYTAEMEDGGT